MRKQPASAAEAQLPRAQPAVPPGRSQQERRRQEQEAVSDKVYCRSFRFYMLESPQWLPSPLPKHCRAGTRLAPSVQSRMEVESEAQPSATPLPMQPTSGGQVAGTTSPASSANLTGAGRNSSTDGAARDRGSLDDAAGGANKAVRASLTSA